MKKLTVFFKQLRISQILTVFLATVVLFVSTACNNGDLRGARPDNPPVQAGGANNPYKSGGDTNTNFNLSPDPKVSSEAAKSKGYRSDLQITSNQLIAASDQLQYPSGELTGQPADETNDLRQIDLEDFEKPEAGGLIQRESNVGDRIKDRLETVKESFGKASEFITEGAKEGAELGLEGRQRAGEEAPALR
jgi:hypothetical protein